MQSTVQTTKEATPMRLVFRRDAIMNLTFELTFNAYWHLIKQCKQWLINQSSAKENSNQIAHAYKVDDLVLVKNKQSSKYSKDAYNSH